MSTEIAVIFLRSGVEPQVRFCRGCSSPVRGEYWSHYLIRCMTRRSEGFLGVVPHRLIYINGTGVFPENSDYNFLWKLHEQSFEPKSQWEAVDRAELVVFLFFDDDACTSIKGYPCDDYPHLWVRPQGIVHACPPEGSGLTPCCNKTPFELPRFERITLVSAKVTCGKLP